MTWKLPQVDKRLRIPVAVITLACFFIAWFLLLVGMNLVGDSWDPNRTKSKSLRNGNVYQDKAPYTLSTGSSSSRIELAQMQEPGTGDTITTPSSSSSSSSSRSASSAGSSALLLKNPVPQSGQSTTSSGPTYFRNRSNSIRRFSK